MRSWVLMAAVSVVLAVAASCDTGDGKDLADVAPTTTQPALIEAPDPSAPGDGDGRAPEGLVTAPLQGETLWAVYLATGSAGDDPGIEAAIADAESQGLEPTVGEISCDHGAAETLQLPETAFAVTLYFSTEEDARRFAATYEPAPVAVIQVEIYCTG